MYKNNKTVKYYTPKNPNKPKTIRLNDLGRLTISQAAAKFMGIGSRKPISFANVKGELYLLNDYPTGLNLKAEINNGQFTVSNKFMINSILEDFKWKPTKDERSLVLEVVSEEETIGCYKGFKLQIQKKQ